jgi:hypothetical protein
MTTLSLEKDRRIVPRWREYKATFLSKELELFTFKDNLKPIDYSESLHEKMDNWIKNNSIETASELIS